MPSYRLAVRRTQKQLDAEKVSKDKVSTADRKALQAAAKAAGIPANQSTAALRQALS